MPETICFKPHPAFKSYITTYPVYLVKRLNPSVFAMRIRLKHNRIFFHTLYKVFSIVRFFTTALC